MENPFALRLVQLLCPVLLLSAAAGCSRIPDAAYFPKLSAGSVREYAVESSAPKTPMTKGKWVRRIEGEIEMDGKQYLKEILDPSGFPGMLPATTYIRHSPEGVYVLEEDAKPRIEHLEFPLPVLLGKEWSYASTFGSTRCRVEGVEDLEIGGRVVKGCVRISRLTIFKDDKEAVSQTWYAPKVGEVKMTTKPVKDVVVQATLIQPAG